MAKRRRHAKKTCKCGPVKGTKGKKCRKTIKKGPRRGQCPKRPRKHRR
jgi:hypothetical protein